MANQRLMKKVAPVVLSAAVAMTSMPATAFAADFYDTEVTVAEESADIEEASAEAADTDVVEDTEDTDVDVEEAAEDVTADEETSDEELSVLRSVKMKVLMRQEKDRQKAKHMFS